MAWLIQDQTVEILIWKLCLWYETTCGGTLWCVWLSPKAPLLSDLRNWVVLQTELLCRCRYKVCIGWLLSLLPFSRPGRLTPSRRARGTAAAAKTSRGRWLHWLRRRRRGAGGGSVADLQRTFTFSQPTGPYPRPSRFDLTSFFNYNHYSYLYSLHKFWRIRYHILWSLFGTKWFQRNTYYFSVCYLVHGHSTGKDCIVIKFFLKKKKLVCYEKNKSHKYTKR